MLSEGVPTPHIRRDSNQIERLVVQEVDVNSILSPFTEDPKLHHLVQGAISILDLANFCSGGCKMCCLDALPKGRVANPGVISAISLEKALQDPNIAGMFSNKLRIGHAGNWMDHPEPLRVLDIFRSALPDIEIDCWSKLENKPQFIEHMQGILETIASGSYDNVHLNLSALDEDTEEVFREMINKLGGHLKKFGEDEIEMRNTWILGSAEISLQPVWWMIQEGLINATGRALEFDDKDVVKKKIPNRNLYTGRPYLNPNGLYMITYDDSSITQKRHVFLTPNNISQVSQKYKIHKDFRKRGVAPHWPRNKITDGIQNIMGFFAQE